MSRDNEGHYTLENCRFIEFAENVAKDNRGKPLLPERRSKIGVANSRAVKQLTLEGKLIKVWASLTLVNKILNISPSNMSKACKGTNKTLSGYRWKYLTPPFFKHHNSKPTIHKNLKKVCGE